MLVLVPLDDTRQQKQVILTRVDLSVSVVICTDENLSGQGRTKEKSWLTECLVRGWVKFPSPTMANVGAAGIS